MGKTKIFLAIFLLLAYATGIAAAATYSEDLCVNGTPLSGGSAWSDLTYIFDDSISTRGHSVDGNATADVAWVGYQFLSAQPVTRIALSQHTSLNGVSQIEVQYSDNGQDWIAAETLQVQKQIDPIVYYNITSVGAHQYWRLMAAEDVGDADGWYVVEVEMQKEIASAARVNYIKSYNAQAKTVFIKAAPVDANGASIMAEQPYLDIELVSAKPSIAKFEEIFAITAYQDWIINSSQDFVTQFNQYDGRYGVADVDWWVLETVQKECEVPIDGDEVDEDGMPIQIGTEIIVTNVDEWHPFDPQPGMLQSADTTVYYKVVWTKHAEIGMTRIHTVPQFAGVDCPELTWWNGSWSKYVRLDVTNPSAIEGFQAKYNLSYISGMNANFSDIRFVDAENTTECAYWIENKVNGSYANVWIALPANDTWINVYYDNDDAQDASDGDAVFEEYLDKTSTSGWSINNIVVSASNDYLRFYNPTTSNAGCAALPISIYPTKYIVEYKFKTVSLGSSDMCVFVLCDGSLSDRFAQTMFPFLSSQTTVKTYESGVQQSLYSSYSEGTEYGGRIIVNESDSSTGIDYYLYDGDGAQLAYRNNKPFTLGSPADVDRLYIGDMSGGANVDAYFRWIYIRHYAATEPTLALQESAVAPVANFTCNATYGLDSLTVQFNDTSTNEPTAWNWSFGDGNYSTDQNPVHTYSSIGTFDVTLNASNAGGNNVSTETDYIGVWDEQVNVTITNPSSTDGFQGLFNLSYQTGMNSNFSDIRFLDTNGTMIPYWIEDKSDDSYANVWIALPADDSTIYLWYNNSGAQDAGDGDSVFEFFDGFDGSSVDTSNWDIGGSPTISNGILELTDDDIILGKQSFGTSHIYESLVIADEQDVVFISTWYDINNREYIGSLDSVEYDGNFSAMNIYSYKSGSYSDNHICGLDFSTAYRLYGIHRCSISSVKFYQDGVLLASQADTDYIYAGNMTLRLNVWDSSVESTMSVDWARVRHYAATEPTLALQESAVAPVANFTCNATYGLDSLTVQFNDTSTNTPTSWNWSFGDGNYSTDQNPVHTYETIGTFDVTLNVSNAGGYNVSTETDYIGVWDEQVNVTITNPSSTDGFQALFNLSYQTGMNSNFSDIRFLDINGTMIPHWIEEELDDSYANVWIALPADDETIYLWYNNSGAQDASDGDSVFEFFDDFDGTSLDTDKWVGDTEFASVSDGRLTLTSATSNTNKFVYGQTALGTFIVSEIKGRFQGTKVSHGGAIAIRSGGELADFCYWHITDIKIRTNDGATLNSADASLDTSEHTYKIIRNGVTSIAYYIDGEECTNSPLSSDLPTSNLPINFWFRGTDSGYGIEADWVFARNYAATEPVLALESTAEAPVANFTANVTSGDAPLTIGFTDLSENATSWNWSFGDGNYSTDQNVSHTYATLGLFDVKLYVQNDGGDSWKNETSYINITNNLSANFISNVTTGAVPLTVQFNSTSINASSWNWSFGDGNYSIEENPVFIYNSTGLYNVTLTVGNAFGSTNKTEYDYINVTNATLYPPDANFTANLTSGDAPLTVGFIDLSENATSWNWSFGDGNYSTDQNASHTYTTLGLFDVKLHVQNDDGSSWKNESGYVNVTNNLSANFTCNDTFGAVPLAVQFNSTSINASSWNWSFGDGNFSEEENPIFIYNGTGLYNVTLTVYNAFGSTNKTEYAYINVTNQTLYPPEANFTANVTCGDAPLTVGFTDTSINATSWNWSFGDGNYSTDQNASHTYATLGLFDVKLHVQNDDGGSWKNESGYINVTNNLTAGFSSNVTKGAVPLTVQFNSTCINASSWNWSFGDGNYSVEENPIFIYNSTGIYNVTLTASNAFGSTCKSEIEYINVTNATPYPPEANFTANITEGYAPLSVGFTDTSINATSWNWSFGDGNYSTDQNASHTYATIGLFDVKLHVQNEDGDSWKNESGYINVTNNLTVNFTSNVTFGYVPFAVQFNSTGINATSWNWSFGDGNYSGDENPIYIYNSTGVYNVSLTAGNGFGTLIKNETAYINASEILYPPEANFSSNVTFGYAPFAVQFNDTGVNATSWNWSFGDGTYSSVQNATHTYMGSGLYDVKLYVQNAEGDDWKNETAYINASTWVSANFTANRTIVNVDLNQFVQFNSTSANATLFNWTFGDGSVSTDENPLYNYSQTGNFTVNLTASDGYSNVTFSREDYIWAGHNPVANFTASHCSGDAPLNASFSASIAEYATAYNWSFGDGYYAETCNAYHVYTNAGTYTVNLTVTNIFGTDTMSVPDQVTVYGEYDANFIYNATTGQVPLTVQFNDTSVGTYDSWLWDFGDDTNSTSRNVTHTYTEAGTYTVSLTADGPHGDDTETKTDLITAWDVPDAEFTASPRWGISPLIVHFIDESTGIPTSWNWSFGDGYYSTSQNPYHTYTSDGTYTIKLWVNNSHGSSWENKSAYIVVDSYNPLSTSAICPKYHYDVQNTNRCPYDIGFGGWEEWTSDPLGDPADAMNTIFTVTSNGTVLTGIENQYYYALDGEDGSVLWQNATADDARGAAAIAQDGTIYVAQESGGSLVAYNADGSIKWQTSALGIVVGMPTIGETGVVYSLGHNGSGNYLHALNPNTGGIWWSQSLGVYPSGCPAILDTGSKEHIIICSDNIDSNYIYMVTNDSGSPSLNWSYSLGDACGPNSPVVDEDSNTVYILTYATLTSSSTLYAFEEDGTPLWNTPFTGYAEGVTLDDDGYPYIFFDNGVNHYLKKIFPPTGAVMWTTQISYGDEAPLYADNGYLVCGGYYGYDIVDTDGDLIDDVSIKNGDTPYVLGANGLIYCSAQEGSGKEVIAFNTNTEPKLVADFEVSATTGTVPINIQFTDTSTHTNPITSWTWSLGDAMVSEQNPSYTYEEAGTYSIALFISNADGSSQMIRSNYLTFTNSSHSADYTGRYPECEYLRTLGATGVSSSEVTLWGEVVNYTGSLETWFEYGTESNSYGYSTKAYSTTATDTFSRDLAGLEHGLIAGETIYYRAACEYGFGDEMCVSLDALSPHPTTNYGIDADQFIYGYDDSGYTFDYSSADITDEDNRDLAGDMVEATWSPYVTTLGAFFFALVIGAIMANMAMKQQSIIIPALIMMFVGSMIWQLFPPEAVQFAQAAFIVGIAGIIYWIFTRRR